MICLKNVNVERGVKRIYLTLSFLTLISLWSYYAIIIYPSELINKTQDLRDDLATVYVCVVNKASVLSLSAMYTEEQQFSDNLQYSNLNLVDAVNEIMQDESDYYYKSVNDDIFKNEFSRIKLVYKEIKLELTFISLKYALYSISIMLLGHLCILTIRWACRGFNNS